MIRAGEIARYCWLNKNSSKLIQNCGLPSGKRLHSYGKSPFFYGKIYYKWAIFNSYVSLPEGKPVRHGIFASKNCDETTFCVCLQDSAAKIQKAHD